MHRVRLVITAIVLASTHLGAAVAAPDPAPPAAAGAPVYALLSLIGDRLDVVVRQLQTGTHVDSNLKQQVAITEPVFDNEAIKASAKAIREAIPTAELAHINTRSTVLFEKQRTLFDFADGQLTMPDAIRDAVRGQGATRLIFIGKHRDDAKFTFFSGVSDGAGKLEGLGFYLDSSWETTSYDPTTGESRGGKGFIAPYAYLHVTLAEFPSGKIVGRKFINASYMAGSGRAEKDIGEPWNALSSAEKVRIINGLVEREVGRAVRQLMAGN